MTQQYPPAPPALGYGQPAGVPPRRSKARRWPWIAGIVVAFLLGTAVGGAGSGAGDAASTAAPRTTTVTAPAPAAPALAGDTPAPTPAAEGPATSFGSGTYEVGVDIQPGKYKTQGGGTLGSCYWARLKNTDGDFDSIIANGNTEGPATVTIAKGDGAFQTTCDSWTKAG